MAAIYIPAQGDSNGPCDDQSCLHRDCAAFRADARLPCRFCGKPLGTDKPVYIDGPEHESCLIDHLQAARS